MENCFNTTRPVLSHGDSSNRIYQFSPEHVEIQELDSRLLKRSKSVKSLDHPVSFIPSISSSAISKTLNNPTSKRRIRRRKPTIKLSSCEFHPSQNKYALNGFNSDSEFSFTSNSDSDFDLESLPDLMDDNNTPLSSPNPLTPKNCFLEQAGKFFDDYKPKKLRLVEEWSPRTPSIFDIPEIVHKILDYAAIQNDNSPQELAPLRRKPLSYNHALLIHGNKRLAEESMKIDTSKDYNCTNVLYNCLFVNKLFNSVANEILGKRFYFEDGHKLKTFVQNVPKSVNFKPTDFKLYKMFHLTNECLQPVLYSLQFQNLQTIEVFMCPRFLPTPEMFEYGQNIKKIVICGSKCLDDDYLIMISTKCPNLEVLDIRGCELVTDSGIYHIGKNCHKLTSINLGRKSKGHLITDAGVSTLVKNNVNLDTVGLAGCHITDKTLWDLTTYCNYSIQRISVNSCPLVTNQSIPLILHANYLPLLNVLEIRFTKVDNLKPIIEFKRRQEFNGVSILIEMCEALSFKMRQQELELDKSISERIFNDIQDWANDSDDGDTSYLTLLSSRSSGRSSRVTSSTS